MLRSDGHAVTAARTGREAIRLLSQEFDLVVLDIVMPEADGFEVIAFLRKRPGPPRVLAISGGGSYMNGASYIESAAKLGAHGVLEKPFGIEQLRGAITRTMAETGG